MAVNTEASPALDPRVRPRDVACDGACRSPTPCRSSPSGTAIPMATGSRPGPIPPSSRRLLRAKGHDVTIVNAGQNGDMTAETMARLNDAIPEATDAAIVFLGRNDWRKGVPAVTIARNLDVIVGALRAAASRCCSSASTPTTSPTSPRRTAPSTIPTSSPARRPSAASAADT